MKKLITAMILVLSLFILVACSENEDRSFSIDEVAIDAQIDQEGIIHVRELYTYTFDGVFEGMTRSIDSDVNQFKAYGIDGQTADPTISLENLEPLTTEKEDSTWKIYSSSEDETKQVLYSYTIEGSVKKYQDVADLTYSFFDESNETDLNNVEITIHTPENMVNEEHTQFFLHDDVGGELAAAESHLIYTNELLAAGDRSEIRLIFPAEELSDMKVTKNKQMEDKILSAELELIERAEHLDQNIDKLVPVMWLFIAVVIILGIVMLRIHPNRYRGNKSVDEFAQLLEETDPLFVSYLNLNGYLQDNSVIAALFSLKQRRMITLEEVASTIDQDKTTFRFTWKKDARNVDTADGYLREWLFTEHDEDGAYFLLESITDNEDEADDVREKKAEEFGEHYDIWSGLVKSRAEYQELKRPFSGFSRLSSMLIIITFASFYYLTKVDVISQIEQLVLPLILAIVGGVCLIFSRHKWLTLFYYPFLIITSLIAFTMTMGTILTVTFYAISFFVLLIIPSTYWREDVLKIKNAIKQSRKLMRMGEYPVGSHPDKMEKRLEYAMILDEGDHYSKQFEEMENISKLNYPLLSNPNYATETFNTGNLMLLSLIAMDGTSISTSTTTTTPTGGGGAGAF
ncbi:MAG TPA: DUF2207 domain-containing protein [Bacillota bacterium]|nr:DUF2207 domain-containing protein [Bacillota bacterium]